MNAMTKQEKIASLAVAMKQSIRGKATQGQLDPEGEKYYHFTDDAPEELQKLYLEHYEVRDVDYETFSDACDIMSEIYNDESQEDDGLSFVEDAIYERASDSASCYTSDLLDYINIWNQDEISQYVRDLGIDIAQAAGNWYDQQVENMCFIIKDWVEND